MQVVEEPPLLYDLTTLQKEANSKYGFSADKTLSIAQKLYEQKYITYPRTGSRYISDDIFNEIPGLIAKLAKYNTFASYAGRFHDMELNIRSVDSKKVTDHHALLVTGHIPEKIVYDERKIYDMVAGRVFEAFSRKCVKDNTIVTLNCRDVLYTAKGSVTIITGWREVFGKDKDSKEESKDKELSYYRLTLLAYLKESHPHLVSDTDFIKTRAGEATEPYSNAIKDGLSQTVAEELANQTLFRRLLFSRHDTIVNVLWNEFSDIVPQSEAKDYAIRILSQCEFLFLQYPISDEFASSPESCKLFSRYSPVG